MILTAGSAPAPLMRHCASTSQLTGAEPPMLFNLCSSASAELGATQVLLERICLKQARLSVTKGLPALGNKEKRLRLEPLPEQGNSGPEKTTRNAGTRTYQISFCVSERSPTTTSPPGVVLPHFCCQLGFVERLLLPLSSASFLPLSDLKPNTPKSVE